VIESFSPDERGTRITRSIAAITAALGSFPAILLSVVIIIVWGVSGPVFRFSTTWQLVINTFTTLVTFVMVFIIQNTQNREGRAMHAKLDELITTQKEASNRLVALEDEPEKDIKEEQDAVRRRAQTRPRGNGSADVTTGRRD
jgi:low affinity Fe/Cu permease